MVLWVRLVVIAIVAVIAGCVAPRTAGMAAQTTPTSEPRIYIVQRGDTLYAISVKYDLDYREIAKNNHIRNPAHIWAGMRLVLGGGSRGRQNSVDSDGSKNIQKHAVIRSEKSVRATEVSQSERQKEYDVKNTTEAFASDKIEWQWPVKGKVIHGFSDRPLGNKGIDISGKRGEPVFAAADGSVVYVGSGLVGYGRMVIIRHGERYLSVYAHNDVLLVHEGDKVHSGQVIARLGESGTNQFELHFEIRKEGHPVDPERFLPRSIHQVGL